MKFFFSVVVFFIVMSATMAPVAAQGYSCGQYVLPGSSSAAWTDQGGGVTLLGYAGLFPQDYYYSGSSGVFRVEVLAVVEVRQPYGPGLSLFTDVQSLGTYGVIGTYYVTGTSLRIQTQFASFRVRVSLCTVAPPTSTPTPPLPTATPFSGMTGVMLCGTPTPIPSLPPLPSAQLPTSSLPFTRTATAATTTLPVVPTIPAVPAAHISMCEHFDGGITNTLDLHLQYADHVATSVVALSNSLTFVTRQCYVVIPEITIPAIPGITDGFMLLGGLQVCVSRYAWVMRYGDIYLSSIILSLLSFSALWLIFALFRRG